ncbi:MAG: hypothetical protein DRJ41_01910 [Thermoprotei archaeon]|nr:MAG: hypothetical protein DRJ41_01910 [Thermoprotei archaeon]
MSNYRKGRYAEYRLMDYLRRLGAVYVTRSAGSHTLFDVVALFPNGEVWFIQVKRGKARFKEKREIEELGKKVRGEKIVFVLARYDKGKWYLDVKRGETEILIKK